MKNVKFNSTVEHRFVFTKGEAPKAADERFAFPVSEEFEIPETDLVAQVWRINGGAQLSVSDKDHQKLTNLKDSDGISLVGEPHEDAPERPVLVAPDPTDPNDRTPRAEAEKVAQQAGHTVEGKIVDTDTHVEHAKRAGKAPGGEAAVTSKTPVMPPQKLPVNPPPGASAQPQIVTQQSNTR